MRELNIGIGSKENNRNVIVQVVQHLQLGGIECMVLDLKRFSESHYDVHIISLEKKSMIQDGFSLRLQDIDAKIHYLNKSAGLQPKLVYRLIKLIKRLKADVVHTHHIGPLLYGGIAARLAGIKTIIHTEHDAWHLQNTRRRTLQRTILNLVKPILVADAELVAKEVGKYIPGVNPIVIRNGVDLGRFVPGDKLQARRALGLPLDKKLVGCAARLAPEKAHDMLIRAVSELHEECHLAIAGDGIEKNNLLKLVRSLGLTKRVHFLGTLSDTSVFYQALDVFCLASRHEGMPLSPLEAQACGIPVVLTDTGGTNEVICPLTGKLVEVDNVKMLAHTLGEKIFSKSTLSPRRFVENTADIKSTVARYLGLVQKKQGGINYV